ncbi:MAG: hypothetical protein RSA57_03935 [Cetobacterium sp.]|uniref:hypothetical protein n=1 Tax=Bacteria TaxID=2 RepID=UPI002FC67E95
MTSNNKLKSSFLCCIVFIVMIFTKATNVYASDENYGDLERIFSNESTAEEKRQFIETTINSPDSNISIETYNEFELCVIDDNQNKILLNQQGSKANNYLQRIKELSHLDISELRSLGFSEERINAIRSFENLTRTRDINVLNPVAILTATRASATCTVYSNLAGYRYDHTYANKSYKTLAYVSNGWEWSSCPVFGYKDSFAAGWSSSTNLQLLFVNSGAEYYGYSSNKLYGEDNYSTQSWNDRPGNLNGMYFKFPLSKSSTNSDIVDLYAKTGYSMNVLMSTDYYVSSFTHNVKYSHSSLNLVPTLTIGSNGLITPTGAFALASTDYPLTKIFYK